MTPQRRSIFQTNKSNKTSEQSIATAIVPTALNPLQSNKQHPSYFLHSKNLLRHPLRYKLGGEN